MPSLQSAQNRKCNSAEVPSRAMTLLCPWSDLVPWTSKRTGFQSYDCPDVIRNAASNAHQTPSPQSVRIATATAIFFRVNHDDSSACETSFMDSSWQQLQGRARSEQGERSRGRNTHAPVNLVTQLHRRDATNTLAQFAKPPQ